MRDINKITLMGRLGTDVTVYNAEDKDRAVAKFSLATKRAWTNAQGDRVEKTQWHNIVCFRGLAALVAGSLAKGSRVYLEGEQTSREYEDRYGNRQFWNEVVVNEVNFLDPRPEVREAPPVAEPELTPQQKAAATRKRNAAAKQAAEIDDDIPF